MKFSSTAITLIVIFLISLTSFSQTQEQREMIISNYDLEKLADLKNEYSITYQLKLEQARLLAEQYNLIKSYNENETFGVLIDFIPDTQTPIYYETTNKGAGITARVDRINSGGSAGLNLDGENMIVGVWDGGRVRESHELFEGRATQQDATTSLSSHATHVTGTIIGSGMFQSGNAKGMAPLANSINYAFSGQDLSQSALEAADGLLVANYSYGVPADGGSGPALPAWYLGKYVDTAHMWDELTYNAPYFLPVKSAGNARGTQHNNQGDNGYDLLTGNANSKNLMVVAATFQVLNYTGPNSVPMAPFSSWGPTDDGRIKPDISAKGMNVFSSVSTSNSSYGVISGTSMSAPSVAGVLLLLQEHYNDINQNFMLSSTLRGLALHTADETGITPGPDYRFGWGLINAEKAAKVISENNVASLILEEELEEGDVYTLSVNASQLETLMASITWTDVEGPISPNFSLDLDTPVLVNDLDIRLLKEDGTTYFPWILDHKNFTAAATKGDNYRDNIEKIEIENPSAEYIVRVSHKGTITNNNQVFSLILSGIDKEDFTLSSHTAIREICNTVDQVVFNIDAAVIDGFSDIINFTVSNLPAGATANLSQTSLNTDGSFTLTVSDLAGLPGGDYLIKLTGTSSVESVNVYLLVRVLGDDFSTISLISPEDNEIDVSVDVVLEWNTPDTFVQEFDVEIATDDLFTNIVESATVNTNNYQTTLLEEFTEYFWRVLPKNDCATGLFSDEFRFVTGELLSNTDSELTTIKIYPNPTSDFLNIESIDIISNIEITNTLGQTISSYIPSSNKVQIDMTGFSIGTYFVKIDLENKTDVYQIIKK